MNEFGAQMTVRGSNLPDNVRRRPMNIDWTGDAHGAAEG
jgi:hypothetical protein